MSQTDHPLDAFHSLIDEGVDNAELAKMADVSVTEVKKYKARLAKSRAEAAKATEAAADETTPPSAESATVESEPPAPTRAVAKGKKGDLVAEARKLAMAHPGKLVLRLKRGFGIRTQSPRSGKPTTHPVQRSDYKDGMAVRIAQLCVEHGHSDAVQLMDPADSAYPPSPGPLGVR